jgi:hypothetical protein
MKRYCLDCGAPTEYSLKKPQFCSNCGQSFENNQASSNASIAKNVNQKRFNKISEIDVDYNNYEDDDIDSVPNINKLEVETFVEKNKGEKIRDLIKNPSKPTKRSASKEKVQKISSKKILEDFKREAGSIRALNKK